MDLLKKIFQSSQDPQQLSLTVKGILASLVPVAGMLLKLSGHMVDNNDLNQVVDVAGNVVIAFGTLFSACGMLWGLIRKFIKPTSPAA